MGCEGYKGHNKKENVWGDKLKLEKDNAEENYKGEQQGEKKYKEQLTVIFRAKAKEHVKWGLRSGSMCVHRCRWCH